MSAIDPRKIHTRHDLTQQLAQLFRDGGWSVHRLAGEAGLGTATVQGILKNTV